MAAAATLAVCTGRDGKMQHCCPSRAATRECFVFLRGKKKMLVQGKAESKWGVISACRMSVSSKYLKESKTEEEGKSRIIFLRKLWGLE